MWHLLQTIFNSQLPTIVAVGVTWLSGALKLRQHKALTQAHQVENRGHFALIHSALNVLKASKQ